MEKILRKSGAVVLIDGEDEHHCRALQLGRDGIIYARWWSNKKQVRVALHRLIMSAPKHLQVDHVNRNRFDNRKSNLRLCTPSENTCNRGRPKKVLKHRFRGIAYIRDGLKKPWQPRLKIHGRQIYGKYCATDVEAARAYDALARKYHGAFAQLNFPD